MSRFNDRGMWILGSVLIVSGLGCGGRPQASLPASVGVTESHRMSPPLLVSEIQGAEDPASLVQREFVLANSTPTPQATSLAAKSCSCYGVLLNGEPWEARSPVVLQPFEQRTLAFDVQPPLQAGEKSWSVTLSLGESPPTEQIVRLGVRVYADLILEPESIFASTRLAELAHASPPADDSPLPTAQETKRRPLTIQRTWRSIDGGSGAPEITEHPPWASFASPVAVGEPREIAPGLWQQVWGTEVHFGCHPDSSSTSESPDHRSNVPRPEVRPDIYPFSVTFADRDGGRQSVKGRIVLKEETGVTAPSVVHWGQIPPGTWRKRRILLTSSDARAFQLTGGNLGTAAQGDAPFALSNRAEHDEGVEPNAGDDAIRLSTPFIELNMHRDASSAGAQQSIMLEIRAQGAGTVDETLILKTDHPRAPEIRIRLRAVAQEAPAAPHLTGD